MIESSHKIDLAWLTPATRRQAPWKETRRRVEWSGREPATADSYTPSSRNPSSHLVACAYGIGKAAARAQRHQCPPEQFMAANRLSLPSSVIQEFNCDVSPSYMTNPRQWQARMGLKFIDTSQNDTNEHFICNDSPPLRWQIVGSDNLGWDCSL